MKRVHLAVAAAIAVFGVGFASPVAGEPAVAPVQKKAAEAPAPRSFEKKPANGTKARCAVTGEAYTVSDKTAFVEYKGRLYALCCADCKPDFDKDPAKFAAKK